MKFSRFKTFIFDLDGTAWNWKELLPGMREVAASLRKGGKQVLFVTNNTMVRRKQLVEKLNGFGVECREDELISSSMAIAEFLKQKKAKAFVIGDGLKEDLREDGIEIYEDKNVDYIIIGHDFNFNYQKVLAALRASQNGAKLIAAATGRVYTHGNELWPGTGCIVKAIEYACNKKALFLGKPSDIMCQLVQLFVQSPRKDTVVFGDELKADVGLAKKCGYFGVLVKTGIDREVKGEIRPDFVINSLEEVEI
ncbi:MAG: HAD-IIA family hydrolase [Candidatus Aenigmatarchaeota archaeon]